MPATVLGIEFMAMTGVFMSVDRKGIKKTKTKQTDKQKNREATLKGA